MVSARRVSLCGAQPRQPPRRANAGYWQWGHLLPALLTPGVGRAGRVSGLQNEDCIAATKALQALAAQRVAERGEEDPAGARTPARERREVRAVTRRVGDVRAAVERKRKSAA